MAVEKMAEKTLREICAETGASRRAVQGYEKAGLVSAVGTNKYGHLLYDETGKEQISRIFFFQRIGFSIREIQELMNAPIGVQKELLYQQITKMEARQEELQELILQTQNYIDAL